MPSFKRHRSVSHIINKYEHLRFFRRKRVNLGKYVKDFYLENGIAYISMNVQGYYDVVDRYSVPEYEWPCEEFTHFLETNAEYIPVEYPIVLEICGYHFSDKEKSAIEEMIHDYYALKMGDAQLEVRRNERRSLMLLALTIIFAFAFYLLGYIHANDTFNETIAIFFWFGLWELGDCAWFEHSDLMEEQMAAAQMTSIKVVFKDVFLDDPTPEKVKETILADVFDEKAAREDWEEETEEMEEAEATEEEEETEEAEEAEEEEETAKTKEALEAEEAKKADEVEEAVTAKMRKDAVKSEEA